MDRIEEWRQLEEGLTNLVDSMSDQFALSDRELLLEFIHNREYGVALEWLHSIIIKAGLRPSAGQGIEIQRLAKSMEIDLE
jgi:hypothetical protein